MKKLKKTKTKVRNKEPAVKIHCSKSSNEIFWNRVQLWHGLWILKMEIYLN